MWRAPSIITRRNRNQTFEITKRARQPNDNRKRRK